MDENRNAVVEEKISTKQERSQTKNITIRLTPEDFILLQERVKESGMNQAKFLRTAIFNCEIVSLKGAREILILLKNVSAELSRIGNNVNQISAKLNSGGFIEPKDWKIVRAEFENIKKELDESWRLLRRYGRARH